jgi:hypothetical protein
MNFQTEFYLSLSDWGKNQYRRKEESSLYPLTHIYGIRTKDLRYFLIFIIFKLLTIWHHLPWRVNGNHSLNAREVPFDVAGDPI